MRALRVLYAQTRQNEKAVAVAYALSFLRKGAPEELSAKLADASDTVQTAKADDAIGKGKLGERAQAEGSDEIAHLARGVNEMSERLKEVEEMKRKLQQGSQQTQGEVFEQEFIDTQTNTIEKLYKLNT